MADTNPENSHQPKTVQKLLTRTAVLAFGLAALFGGFRWYQDYTKDPNHGKAADTNGDILAIKLENDGQKLVDIHNGTFKTTSSWKPGVQDRDPVWSPDGNSIYFVSDRKENNFHVFRWSPESDDAESRTVGKRSRSAPSFINDGSPDANNSLLLVSGGAVLELIPKEQATPQILPPAGAEIAKTTGDESGTDSQFSSIYGQLGNSFRIARWTPGKKCIVAVMRKDEGEVLIIQDMTPTKDGKAPSPQPIVAGSRVDFDISPTDGTIVFALQGFQWPPLAPIPESFKKDGKITTPFRHGVGFMKPGPKERVHMMVAQGNNDASFGSPAISPDGKSVAIIVGKYTPEGLVPGALINAPIADGSFQQSSLIARGEIYEPSWHPNAKLLCFARRDPGGHRAIYTIQKDGSSERNITGSQGDFLNPHFSPQSK